MKYIKSLNWSGYLILLVIFGIAGFGNKNTIDEHNNIDFRYWLILFGIGALLGLFILIAGRNTN